MSKQFENSGLGRRGFLQAGLAGGAIAAMSGSASAASSSSSSLCEAVIATTAHGRLRGRQVGKVQEFRGVRYAEPQTAANRFNAPIPLKPWTGTRDALEDGLMAMQIPTRGGLWVLSFRDYHKKSEDCLTLNVYTPGIGTGKKRAVMFWCHGGGFATGSGNVPVYDGHNLAEHGDVVVVTVNHRLNVFGFSFLQDVAGGGFADSGNAGMLDLIEALRWVRDNIAEFGGDPGNVTIFGESGGGGKVSTLLGMPAAAGLFKKAIVQSGSGLRQHTREAATEASRKVLAACGLGASDAAKLRDIPAHDFLMKTAQILRALGPVVDGKNLPRHSFDPDASPLARDIPMIIGTNQTEAVTFSTDAMWELTDASLRTVLTQQFGEGAQAAIEAYKGLYPKMSPSDLYFRIATDLMMRRNAIIQAERKIAQGGAPVYMYLLTYPSPVDGGRWHTPHAMDLPFMFRNQQLEQMVDLVGEGPDQDRVADQMSSAWLAFAKTGKPSNPVTGNWTPYDLSARNTMVFDSHAALVSDAAGADRKLFMSLTNVRGGVGG